MIDFIGKRTWCRKYGIFVLTKWTQYVIQEDAFRRTLSYRICSVEDKILIHFTHIVYIISRAQILAVNL